MLIGPRRRCVLRTSFLGLMWFAFGFDLVSFDLLYCLGFALATTAAMSTTINSVVSDIVSKVSNLDVSKFRYMIRDISKFRYMIPGT